MISKLKSTSVSYILLLSFGIMFIVTDKYLDQFELNEGLYDQTIELFEDHLDQSIGSVEDQLISYKAIKGVLKKEKYDKQEKISDFYQRLKLTADPHSSHKLSAAIEVVQPKFKRYFNDEVGFTGLNVVDAKSLYLTYMQSLVIDSRGCWDRPYRIVSSFDQQSKVYHTHLVKDILQSNFVLIYDDVAYGLHEGNIFIRFSEEDIIQGFAKVILRDKMTLEEKEVEVEIPRYAFRV